jgi:hypothetical protein
MVGLGLLVSLSFIIMTAVFHQLSDRPPALLAQQQRVDGELSATALSIVQHSALLVAHLFALHEYKKLAFWPLVGVSVE